MLFSDLEIRMPLKKRTFWLKKLGLGREVTMLDITNYGPNHIDNTCTSAHSHCFPRPEGWSTTIPLPGLTKYHANLLQAKYEHGSRPQKMNMDLKKWSMNSAQAYTEANKAQSRKAQLIIDLCHFRQKRKRARLLTDLNGLIFLVLLLSIAYIFFLGYF